MKSPGPGFRHVFEALAPAHPGLAGDDVDHALQRAVVVHAGLGVGLDRHGAGPDFLGADPCGVDRRLPEHAGRLRRVGIEPVAGDHPHAVVLPARGGAFVVVMIVRLMVVRLMVMGVAVAEVVHVHKILRRRDHRTAASASENPVSRIASARGARAAGISPART
ncbi:hypothetical protein M2440_000495 [Methylorubrum extorquens]|nr:hypothetical protein [Methylorubrum extorquens]